MYYDSKRGRGAYTSQTHKNEQKKMILAPSNLSKKKKSIRFNFFFLFSFSLKKNYDCPPISTKRSSMTLYNFLRLEFIEYLCVLLPEPSKKPSILSCKHEVGANKRKKTTG